MSKNADGPRGRFLERLERFRGARVQRGGFEGPENVPPLKPDQIPVIIVDGVPVRPKIVPAESASVPADSEPASDPPKAKAS